MSNRQKIKTKRDEKAWAFNLSFCTKDDLLRCLELKRSKPWSEAFLLSKEYVSFLSILQIPAEVIENYLIEKFNIDPSIFQKDQTTQSNLTEPTTQTDPILPINTPTILKNQIEPLKQKKDPSDITNYTSQITKKHLNSFKPEYTTEQIIEDFPTHKPNYRKIVEYNPFSEKYTIVPLNDTFFRVLVDTFRVMIYFCEQKTTNKKLTVNGIDVYLACKELHDNFNAISIQNILKTKYNIQLQLSTIITSLNQLSNLQYIQSFNNKITDTTICTLLSEKRATENHLEYFKKKKIIFFGFDSFHESSVDVPKNKISAEFLKTKYSHHSDLILGQMISLIFFDTAISKNQIEERLGFDTKAVNRIFGKNFSGKKIPVYDSLKVSNDDINGMHETTQRELNWEILKDLPNQIPVSDYNETEKKDITKHLSNQIQVGNIYAYDEYSIKLNVAPCMKDDWFNGSMNVLNEKKDKLLTHEQKSVLIQKTVVVELCDGTKTGKEFPFCRFFAQARYSKQPSLFVSQKQKINNMIPCAQNSFLSSCHFFGGNTKKMNGKKQMNIVSTFFNNHQGLEQLVASLN